MPQLSEKPHQGFATKKTALHPASSVPNFRVTLGLRAVVVENGVREIYSARYYNPSTGRFMSRDPEDGYINLPKTLHKYLYAAGDPVNGIDPRGREDMFETGATMDASALTTAKMVFRIAVWVANIDCAVAATIEAVTKGKNWNDGVPLEMDLFCLASAGYGITSEGIAILMEATE
jgi:RHS repeat-associated protein